MQTKIAITALSSISALGNNPEQIWENYLSDATLISSKKFSENAHFVAEISSDIRAEIDVLKKSDLKYKALDETVLLAILVS